MINLSLLQLLDRCCYCCQPLKAEQNSGVREQNRGCSGRAIRVQHEFGTLEFQRPEGKPSVQEDVRYGGELRADR